MLSWDEAAEVFNRCYEGYVIPVSVGGGDLAARCLMEDIDPSASYVVDDPSGPVAMGLIARRGNRARLAAFAVVPRARGRRMARPALSRLIEESRLRGDATLELEVFEHNLPAVRLYSGFGFERIDRLVGFELDPSPAENDAPDLVTFPIGELARHLATEHDETLPWQLRPETISRISDPWQVLGDGRGAFALVDLSRSDTVALRLLFTLPSVRRTGRARELAAAIRVLAAGRPVRVPQLIPESHAAFAHALSFTAADHGQLRMALSNG
jgi:GNAT superfamily N-acetyltransferase